LWRTMSVLTDDRLWEWENVALIRSVKDFSDIASQLEVLLLIFPDRDVGSSG
jgi:hypothetical protein